MFIWLLFIFESFWIVVLNAVIKSRIQFTMITFWEQRERMFGEENRKSFCYYSWVLHSSSTLLSLTVRWKDDPLEQYVRDKTVCLWISLLFRNNKNVSLVTHQSRLSCSSCSPVGGPLSGTGNDTARTQRTRGSWCWCPDAVSGSSHRRSWPPLIAASWLFLPLLPARNLLQPRNGRPIHHCRSKREVVI